MQARFSRTLLGGALAALGTCIVLSAQAPAVLGTALTGGVAPRVAGQGDTLMTMAARAGVNRDVLARDNGLPMNARLHPGDVVVIDNRHLVPPREPGERLLVNVAQRILFRFDGDRVAAAYPVAVGRRGWRTPRGPFTILAKEIDPYWDVPATIQEELRRAGKPAPARVPPGPTNPLGARWLGTSFAAIGIHGTPAPVTVYRASTHGCVRLHPDDIADLFDRVAVGDAGRIVYVSVLLGRTPEGVLLEAHPDIYGLEREPAIAAVRALVAAAAIVEPIDWEAVGRVLAARDGVARQVGGTS